MSTLPANRTHLIGGTDAATLIGLGAESPLILYLRLTGQMPDTFEGNAATRAGKLFEEHVAAPEIALQYGVQLRRPAARVMVLPDEPRIGVSFDFEQDGANGPELAEIKLTGSRAIWGALGDRVPLPVAAQAQMQMAVSRAAGRIVPCVHVYATFVPGFVVEDFPVAEDREAGDVLLRSAKAMLARVDSGTPPNPGDEADARALFLGKRGLTVQVGSEHEAMLHAIARDKKAIKEAEARVKALRDSLIPLLGDATEIVDEKGVLLATYRPQRVFMENEFCNDYPALAEEFAVRSLSMTELGKKHKKLVDKYRREPTNPRESTRQLLLKIDAEDS